MHRQNWLSSKRNQACGGAHNNKCGTTICKVRQKGSRLYDLSVSSNTAALNNGDDDDYDDYDDDDE